MENIVEKYIDAIQFIQKEVVENYNGSMNDAQLYTKKQEDLEHEIELDEKKNRTEGYRAYRQLREIRQERRLAKNQNELLKDIYEFFEANKDFFDKLAKVKGSSRKTFEVQNNRVYGFKAEIKPEILTKSQPAFDKMLSDFKKSNKVRLKGGKLRK